MKKFAIRFMLDEKPYEVVVEYIIEKEWEADAIAQAHERWVSEFPEASKKPFLHASREV